MEESDDENSAENEQIAQNDEEKTPQGEPQEFSESEHQKQGYFFVERILKHKYHQGYKFLVKWQNFGIEESTWEPIQSFIIGDGRINETFKAYVGEHALDSAWRTALRLSSRP